VPSLHLLGQLLVSPNEEPKQPGKIGLHFSSSQKSPGWQMEILAGLMLGIKDMDDIELDWDGCIFGCFVG
jgi:hypothetical protein